MSRNRTAYVLLGMLSIEPNQSGYQIRKAIESSVGYFWGESYGQIYPTLKQLAAEGLIVPVSSGSPPRKRRQGYALSEAGRACLREWLAQPFHNDPPRNEFLLKLFFGREAAPNISIAHIRELNERNRRALATAQAIEAVASKENAHNPHLPYWLLTLGLGVALTRAALDWGESALAALSSMEAAAAAHRQPAEGDPAAEEISR